MGKVFGVGGAASGVEHPESQDNKDQAGGYPGLDADKKIASTQITFPQAANQAHSVAATVGALVTDVNALIDKLIAAGLMAGS